MPSHLMWQGATWRISEPGVGLPPRPFLACVFACAHPRAPFNNSAPLGWGPHHPPTPPPWTPPPPLKGWAKFSSGPSADQNFSLGPLVPVSLDKRFSSAPLAPLKTEHYLGGGGWTHPPIPPSPPTRQGWPPRLYKLRPCPSYSGRRDRINLGPNFNSVPNVVQPHKTWVW